MLAIIGDHGPACDRMTIADYAARVAQPSTAPEFHFSRRAPLQEKARGQLTAANSALPARQGPLPPATLRNAVQQDATHKADPEWGTKFTTKFSKKPEADAPMITPIGGQPNPPEFIARAEEIRWLEETQHTELATTQQELLAADLDTSILAEDAAYAVLIGYEEVEVSDAIRFLMNLFGIEKPLVPLYGGQNYIASMKRRIEWEQQRDGCARPHKMQFALTKEGTLGITYDGPLRKDEDILTHKRLVKARWLSENTELPTQPPVATCKRPLDIMNWAQQEEYRSSRLHGTEEEDPWRLAFRMEDDPKPLRGQYAFGNHRACRLINNEVIHNGCTADGDDLFELDLTNWEARHINDVGYAGPKDDLVLDLDLVPSNEEDEDPE